MPFGTYDAIFIPHQAMQAMPMEDRNADRMDFSLPQPPADSHPFQLSDPEPPRTAFHDNIMDIHILVVGRGRNEVMDFITGLFANANPAIVEKGLALFTDDNSLANELLQRKRKLEGLFRTPAVNYKLSPHFPNGNFVFTLSRSGQQGFSVRATFHIASASSAASMVNSCQCVWVLSDAPIYETQGDRYAAAAANILSAAKGSYIPAYIIMTHFEKYDRLRPVDTKCSMDGSVYDELCAKIRASFAQGASYVPVIPVQIYGGLVCKGMTSDGTLVFGDNSYGGTGEYSPVGCHIPLLMSVEKVNTGEQFMDNQLISDIKALNLAQKAEFFNCGVKIGG